MKKKAFTMAELLITVSIAIVLFAGILVLINPLSYIQRGNDIARKKDLDDAKKTFEQYMADTGCYPQPTQICIEGNNASPCHICTRQQSPKFSYFAKDVCDPRQGSTINYLYQTEKVGAVVGPCPRWFRIFSVLDSAYNAAEDIWGCKKGGCGIAPQYGYSYLVTSPGAPTDIVVTANWYCYTNDCVQCSPYENCMSPTNMCYGKQLYPIRQNCCDEHNPHSPFCL